MNWYMSKINLTVFPWYGALVLVSREGRGWSQATQGGEGDLGTGGALLGNLFYERWERRMKE
jgi:hypothetical protein